MCGCCCIQQGNRNSICWWYLGYTAGCNAIQQVYVACSLSLLVWFVCIFYQSSQEVEVFEVFFLVTQISFALFVQFCQDYHHCLFDFLSFIYIYAFFFFSTFFSYFFIFCNSKRLCIFGAIFWAIFARMIIIALEKNIYKGNETPSYFLSFFMEIKSRGEFYLFSCLSFSLFYLHCDLF